MREALNRYLRVEGGLGHVKNILGSEVCGDGGHGDISEHSRDGSLPVWNGLPAQGDIALGAPHHGVRHLGPVAGIWARVVGEQHIILLGCNQLAARHVVEVTRDQTLILVTPRAKDAVVIEEGG